LRRPGRHRLNDFQQTVDRSFNRKLSAGCASLGAAERTKGNGTPEAFRQSFRIIRFHEYQAAGIGLGQAAGRRGYYPATGMLRLDGHDAEGFFPENITGRYDRHVILSH
jgi:hypothetical protein